MNTILNSSVHHQFLVTAMLSSQSFQQSDNLTVSLLHPITLRDLTLDYDVTTHSNSTTEYEKVTQQNATRVVYLSGGSKTLLTTLIVSASVLTTAGNFIILVAFATNRKLLKKSYNVLVLNLCIADYLVGTLDLPFQVMFTCDSVSRWMCLIIIVRVW